jgi:Ca2+-transporting ATPase
MVAVVAFLPPVAAAFGLARLLPGQYGLALGLALVPVVVMEVVKLFQNRPEKRGSRGGDRAK